MLYVRPNLSRLLLVAGVLALALVSVSAQAFQVRPASNGVLLADYGKATSIKYPATFGNAASGASSVAVTGAAATFVTNSGVPVALTAAASMTKADLWAGIVAAGKASGALVGGPYGLLLFGAAGLADYLSHGSYTYDPNGDPDKAINTANPKVFYKPGVAGSPYTEHCYGLPNYGSNTCPVTGNSYASSLRWGMTKAETCSAWAASANLTATLVDGGLACLLSNGVTRISFGTDYTRTVTPPAPSLYKTIDELRADMEANPAMPSGAQISTIVSYAPDGITTTVPTITGPSRVTGTPVSVVTSRTETVIDPATGKTTTQTITTTTTKIKSTDLTYTDGTPTQQDSETTTVQTKTDVGKVNPDGTPVLKPDGTPDKTTTNTTGTSTQTGATQPPETPDPCSLHPERLGCSSWGSPVDSGPVSKESVAVTITPATFASGTCPSPVGFTVFGRSYAFSYGELCSRLAALSSLFLALSALSAAWIFTSGFKV